MPCACLGLDRDRQGQGQNHGRRSPKSPNVNWDGRSERTGEKARSQFCVQLTREKAVVALGADD